MSGPEQHPEDRERLEEEEDSIKRRSRLSKPVYWLADYVYGTITTLVAIAGLTFETHPNPLTTAGVVVVGAIAIWLAHALSRLITTRAWHHMMLRRSDIRIQLASSWPVLAAAIPATLVFTLTALNLWDMRTAFVLADVIGVLSLAGVGIGTAGGRERPMGRRVVYVGGLVGVGVAIVLLESAVHLV
jgi:hypothetical protein